MDEHVRFQNIPYRFAITPGIRPMIIQYDSLYVAREGVNMVVTGPLSLKYNKKAHPPFSTVGSGAMLRLNSYAAIRATSPGIGLLV